MAVRSAIDMLKTLKIQFASNALLRVLLIIPLALIVLSLAFGLEPWLRLAGMSFQLSGFYLVLHSLKQRETLFGTHPGRLILKEWIFNLFNRPEPIGAHAAVTDDDDVARSFAYATTIASAKSSIEDRLKVLEAEHSEIQRKLSLMRQEISDAQREALYALRAEESARGAQVAELKRLLANAMTGDIHIDRFGVLLFCLGIVMASASVEISCLWDWISASAT